MGISLGLHGISIFRVGSWIGNLTLYACALLLWAAASALKVVFIERPEALTSTIFERVAGAELRRRLIEALPILVCLTVFMSAFSAMKSSIPLFNEFDWDARFIELDRNIHGTDAWIVIQPIIGYPLVTSILSLFYHMWILLIYAGGVFFAFRRSDLALRRRYFLSYFLIWTINGCILAILMASVGPCFLEPVLGKSDFKPLMDYLHEADQQYPVLVLEVQNALISWHRLGDHGLGRGITAMPSMHVSLAFLFFLAVRKISRAAAWAAGIFVILILVGSVHLGYHYAVDGYLAIVTTYIIWLLCGWRTKKNAATCS